MAITIKNLAVDFMAMNTSAQEIYAAPATKAAVISSVVLLPTAGSTGTLSIQVKSGSTIAVIHSGPKSAGNRIVHANQITLAPTESLLVQASATPGSTTEIGYVVSGVERDI